HLRRGGHVLHPERRAPQQHALAIQPVPDLEELAAGLHAEARELADTVGRSEIPEAPPAPFPTQERVLVRHGAIVGADLALRALADTVLPLLVELHRPLVAEDHPEPASPAFRCLVLAYFGGRLDLVIVAVVVVHAPPCAGAP